MKTKNLVPRILVSPFVLGIFVITYNYHALKRIISFLRYGGEWINYESKDVTKTIGEVYAAISKEYHIKKGKELIFISNINRDGSGTTPMKDQELKHLAEDDFNLTCLSISNKTYIASAFNSYVVKLKQEKK